MTGIIEIWTHLLIWTVALAAVFITLERVMPCNPGQAIWRRGFSTDMLYNFLLPLINRFARIGFISAGAFIIFYGDSLESMQEYMIDGYGPLGDLPLWAQIALAFILSDILLYWIHRGFHQPAMWKYHAIHHSSEHLDWLSTFRFHPVNTWLSFAIVDAIMILMGFSPAYLSAVAAFNNIYSSMVHANLNWTFGPFKYIFASPVFHRWHHTSQAEGMDKNFAPTFPLLDVIFGTFYMPENRVPTHYGAPGNNIPGGFFQQMIWPFKSK